MGLAQRKADANIEAVSLTPTEGTELLVGMYKAGTYHRTPLLRGSPGCGKTSAVRDAAKELRKIYPDFGYEEINPTMPADEVGGIPDLVRVEGQATRTDYALPAWFVSKEENPDYRAIWCLDDALQGDRMMQQTLANLILARNLRGHKIPDGVMIVATGNRVEDKAGVTRTLTHFADRMCWINISAEPKSWIDDFAIPRGISEKVIAYISMDKSKLDMFDPSLDKCPTSRTWEAVSNHLKFLDTLNAPDKAKIRNKYAQAVLNGELGMGEATKFWAFCQLFGKLPDINKLLQDPANANIDYPLDVQYALIVAIANNLSTSNVAAALEYVERIGADFVAIMLKLSIKRNPDLRNEDAYKKWMVKNQNVILGV